MNSAISIGQSGLNDQRRVSIYKFIIFGSCTDNLVTAVFDQFSSVAYLGFCEGGARAKDARFEAPEAPMGWSVGRGCPLPTEEGVWGGGCAPSPEIKKKFFGSMCSKNFCVQAKGGGHRPVPPPKYATGSARNGKTVDRSHSVQGRGDGPKASTS